MKEIVEIVCDFYNIYPKKIFNLNRKREIAKCRQISMYLARHFTSYSLSEIGAYFDREHATVLHAIKAVEKDSATNKQFKLELDLLMNKTNILIVYNNNKDKYFCNTMIYSKIVRRYRSVV